MKEANVKNLGINFVKAISTDWALLSAGSENGCNAMTVSWGGVGELWGKDVVFVFVRPQRYTKEFMDREDMFTLSFFGGEYKKELGVFGKKSGRDCDKFAETGFTPVFEHGSVYPEQAETVLVCKTLSVQDMDPEKFLDKSIDGSCYENKDYHKVYIAEIVKTLVK